MERGVTMLLHSAVIAFILYLIMTFILKQKKDIAENRSLLYISSKDPCI